MTINRRWIAREWLYLLAGFVWAYVLFPIIVPPLARRLYGPPSLALCPARWVRSLRDLSTRGHNEMGYSHIAGRKINGDGGTDPKEKPEGEMLRSLIKGMLLGAVIFETFSLVVVYQRCAVGLPTPLLILWPELLVCLAAGCIIYYLVFLFRKYRQKKARLEANEG